MSRYIFILLFSLFLQACGESEPAAAMSDFTFESAHKVPAKRYIEEKEVYNPEAVIPPQCYTKTDGKHNPCYACHQSYKRSDNRSNMMSDANLQGDYEFSEVGETNSWKNLFVDRSQIVAGISDEKIKAWINQNNYEDFVKRQQKDESWQGEKVAIQNLAEAALAFDEFGLAKDGSLWVAFNYKPFPSTFWPTNGSTGDAMIRLPSSFREKNGEYVFDVYFANLAIVEMNLKQLLDVTVPEISEMTIGKDLNGNGKLEAQISKIVAQSTYVGDASKQEVVSMLYPEQTEFLHTVRYLGVDEQGKIYNARRMKEVRYMKKHHFMSRNKLKTSYQLEAKEKAAESLPKTISLGQRGIDNGFGWTINAYIEDEEGELRQQVHQEMAFCNGCHKTIGSTIDQTFSFPRKVEGAEGWGYIDLTKMRDTPTVGSATGEFLTYFERVGGGDEFRQNQEMLDKWFNPDGSVNFEKVQSVDNLYELIMPSEERALALNKAYLSIVKEQSYIYGRDATISKAKNVLEQVDTQQPPLKPEHQYKWDIRLDWQQAQDMDAGAEQ